MCTTTLIIRVCLEQILFRNNLYSHINSYRIGISYNVQNLYLDVINPICHLKWHTLASEFEAVTFVGWILV